MAGNVIVFKVPLFNQLIGAIRAGNVDEIARIYFEMYPAENPRRPSDDPAQGSEARPGVGTVIESNPADEKGLASRVEELEEALREAVELIRIFHGEAGWEIYRTHAPEMLRLERALAGKKPADY